MTKSVKLFKLKIIHATNIQDDFWGVLMKKKKTWNISLIWPYLIHLPWKQKECKISFKVSTMIINLI